MLEKYNLGSKLESLSEDAKNDVLLAIQSAEQKITFKTVVGHWREVAIVVLLVAVVLMNTRMNSAVKDLSTKNETYNRLEKIDGIDKSLKSVTDNQTNLYPQMDEVVNQLEATRSQLQEMSTKITAITQTQARLAASKLGVSGVSKDLEQLGYPNEIE